MARPRKFTTKLALRICTEIAQGSNLRKVVANPGMPALSTIMKWVGENPAFSEQYARAREARADARADKIDEIVEGALTGLIDPQAAKVAIDAHKWQAAKEQPKRYGDKVTQELTGPDGGPIQTAGEYRLTPEDESFIQRAAKIRAKLIEETTHPNH